MTPLDPILIETIKIQNKTTTDLDLAPYFGV
jgi:hypothetical protein